MSAPSYDTPYGSDQPAGHLRVFGGGDPAGPTDVGVVPPVPGGASADLPASLVRRSSPLSLLGASLLLLVGVALEGRGFTLITYRDLVGGAILVSLGLPFLALGVVPWGRRTVFDADGIHSSTFFSHADTAWPDSRAAFTVNVSRSGRSSWVATMEVPGRRGSIRLVAPRVSADSVQEALVRGEAEVDDLWAWALARGYARETVLQLQGEPDREGRQSDSVPVDYDLLRQDSLVFRAWPRECADVTGRLLLSLLFGGYGAYLVTHPYEQSFGRGRIFMGHGALTQAFGAACLLAALGLLVGAWSRARARLVASREGLTYFNGLWSKRLEWPRYRSSIFVTALRAQARTVATVHVIGADGGGLRVPGLRWRAKDERAVLRAALQAAETIWVWGTSRGVTVEDDGYDIDPREETQFRRVATARRLEYLMSQPGGLGWG
ncbi:hypothetical protein D5R93_07025 [Actinomyces lilanjuaniae]|uniref:DUF2207 domain-containing protein n=1 Tax=Actinomyces lilanjuaniae TaxID=2321394 RepID=A0ABN5PN33_9ACTO|nr:hypothetical protein [Actinomyces lilanjuaniae]AYD89845.1 hypothetical protein D5R93_07025 [Actinomyces lilanjuaniae]